VERLVREKCPSLLGLFVSYKEVKVWQTPFIFSKTYKWAQ
jgi:hypothetical protein